MILKDFDIKAIKIPKRVRIEMGDIDDLAANIKEKGLIQPISIDKDGNLLAGGRRFLACKKLNHKTIPVVIREIKGSTDAKEIELFENIYRKDLEWAERARLEKEIFDLKMKVDPNWSGRKQAKITNKGRSAVDRRLELAEALKSIPELAGLKTEEAAWKSLKRLEEDAVISSIVKKAGGHYSDESKFARNHYIVGDALKGLTGLKSGLSDFAEVDPPYAIGLQDRKRRSQINRMADYTELTVADYGKTLKQVSKEAFRILKPNAFCIWWFAIQFYSITRNALEESGFAVSDVPAIWFRGQQGQTTNPDSFLASCYETFFVCRKGTPKLRVQGRINLFDFKAAPPSKKIHATEKPIDLMLEILDTFAYPGSHVLVPFLGSGVTLRACYKRKMTGIGFDLSKITKDRFLARVAEDKIDEQEALEREKDERDANGRSKGS